MDKNFNKKSLILIKNSLICNNKFCMLLLIKFKKYAIKVNKNSIKFLTPINAVYNTPKKFCI